MTMPGNENQIKRYRRATFWDYRRNGASLFVTIVVAGRSPAIFTGRDCGNLASPTLNPGGSTGRDCGNLVLAGWGASCGKRTMLSEEGRAVPGPFGQIVAGQMVLNELGAIVAQALDSITRYNPGVTVFGRVVMPDHVHFNVHLKAGLDQPLVVLGRAIARFKNYTIKQSRLLAERSSAIFTERDCGNQAPLASSLGTFTVSRPAGASAAMDGGSIGAQAERIASEMRYPAQCSVKMAGCERIAGSAPCSVKMAGCERIVENASRSVKMAGLCPANSAVAGELNVVSRTVLSGDGRAVPALRWQQGYHDRLCLSVQFIEATERYIAYNPLKWQLMYQTPGALVVHEPLDSPRLDAAAYWKGVGNLALLSPDEKIVALRISRRLSRAQIEAAVARMDKAVDAGYIVLSGFISPGEKAVRDRLCARKNARFIRILPSAIPNRRFKPESRYVEAFLANRYLEIACGNDEVEFSRAACLDYNAEIVEIAKAGQGVALYFRPDGVGRA